MKKRIGLTIIILFLSLFIYCDKVNAAYMWVECPKYQSTNSYSRFQYFGVYTDKHGEPRLIAFPSNTDLMSNRITDCQTEKYGAWGHFWNSLGVDTKACKEVGPTIIASKGDYTENRSCWLDGNKIDKNCATNDTPYGTSTMLLEGYCPIYVKETDNPFGLDNFALVMYGTTNNDVTRTKQLTESNFIIYEYRYTRDNFTYITTFAEGYDAFSGRYSYFTNNQFHSESSIINYWPNDGSLSAPQIGCGKLDNGSTFCMYVKEAFPPYGASQIARMNNCITYDKRYDYYNLSEDNYCSLFASLEGTKEQVQFKLKYDSSDSNGAIKYYVDEWYEKNQEAFDTFVEMFSQLEGENGKLFEAAEGIKKSISSGKMYIFEDDYSISQMIKDLEKSYSIIAPLIGATEKDELFKGITIATHDKDCNEVTSAYSGEALKSSLQDTFYCKTFGMQPFKMIGVNYIDPNTRQGKYIISNINNKLLSELVKGKNIDLDDIINAEEKIRNYAILYSVATEYIKNNYDQYSMRYNFPKNEIEIKALEDMTSNYSELIKIYGVDDIVIDCKSLISDELREKIEGYVNIIKIAIPIILIGIGTIDFFKAMFSSDDEKMKKAQKDFIKRILIAILIFLSPVFVDLLLTIANKVWFYINPDTCGIWK